jgi:hypothetical protein
VCLKSEPFTLAPRRGPTHNGHHTRKTVKEKASVMASAALDETQGYEMFKENKFEEAQQVMDDLDDFERRLAGGVPMVKAAAPPKPAAKAPPKPASKASGNVKAGSEYVKASRVAKSEEEEDADAARKAVSDLDKFEQRFGLSGDF